MRNRFLGLTVVALVTVACGQGGSPSPSAPSALVQPANIAGNSITTSAVNAYPTLLPALGGGAIQLASVQFNADTKTFDVQLDIIRGAIEASPNTDFGINTTISGDGIIVGGSCPLADTKPISETAGTMRVQQSLPYAGVSGTFNVAVTTQLLLGDSTLVGPADTGNFTVTIP